MTDSSSRGRSEDGGEPEEIIMVSTRSVREIAKIRESSRIVYEILDFLEDKIVPGVTGKEIDSLAEEHIRSQGAEPAFKGYLGYPSTICFSKNEKVVHGIPDGRTLDDGDIVSIDCGAIKDGYYGDSARTYTVGSSIGEDVQKLLDVTERSLYVGIEQAKSGNHVSDIGHKIQEYVESFGFSIVRELVGHGIGTQLHENPQIPNYGDAGQGVELKAGMCLAIEPMVNLGGEEVYTEQDGWTICTRDGKPSAHFEHTIVVGEEGGRILSNGFFDD